MATPPQGDTLKEGAAWRGPQVELVPEPEPGAMQLGGWADDNALPTLDDLEEVEVLLAICAHLCDPKDLGRLARASSSFGRPIEWSTVNGSAPGVRSVAAESARRWVLAWERSQRVGAAAAGLNSPGRDRLNYSSAQPGVFCGFTPIPPRWVGPSLAQADDRATCAVCTTNFQVGEAFVLRGSYGHWLPPTTVGDTPFGMYGDGVSTMWVASESRPPKGTTAASPNLHFCSQVCEDRGGLRPTGYVYRVIRVDSSHVDLGYGPYLIGEWRRAQYHRLHWDIRHRWARRMHEIQACRFVAHNYTITLSEQGAVATMGAEKWYADYRSDDASVLGRPPRQTGKRRPVTSQSVASYGIGAPVFRTAAGGGLLAAGRHRAVFVVQTIGPYSNGMFFGVVAQGSDVRGGDYAHYEAGNSFFGTNSGRRFPGGDEWPGSQRAQQGDRVGLLLDTTEGSLTVFLNDVLLGVMVESGLTGRYRWAVSMYKEGDSVRIEPAPTMPLSNSRNRKLKTISDLDDDRSKH